MSRASLKGARKSKRTDNTEQASTSASMTPMWRPAICVSSEAVATVRVVKQSRNQLHTGRATLRNTRHKPMSSEGAPLVDLSCSRCRCCTKTSSVHGRVCDHVKRIKRVLPTSSRPLARDSIWRRQAPPWPARRAGTRLNGASRGRQKRGGFPHARGKSLSFGEGGRKVAAVSHACRAEMQMTSDRIAFERSTLR